MESELPSTRKFYKHTILLEVLSEEGTLGADLFEIAEMCYDGPCSGDVKYEEQVVVDGVEMARLLREQRSDPDIFELTPEGEDSE